MDPWYKNWRVLHNCTHSFSIVWHWLRWIYSQQTVCQIHDQYTQSSKKTAHRESRAGWYGPCSAIRCRTTCKKHLTTCWSRQPLHQCCGQSYVENTEFHINCCQIMSANDSLHRYLTRANRRCLSCGKLSSSQEECQSRPDIINSVKLAANMILKEVSLCFYWWF